MSMTFEQVSERVDRYISQFSEGYFPPLQMLARLTDARILLFRTRPGKVSCELV